MSATAEPDDEPSEELLSALRDAGEKLGPAAQKIGLYLQGFRIAQRESDEGMKWVIIGDFLMGDVALSDRIIQPEAHDMDEQFRGIVHGAENDEFEEYRAKLQKEIDGEGGDEDHG